MLASILDDASHEEAALASKRSSFVLFASPLRICNVAKSIANRGEKRRKFKKKDCKDIDRIKSLASKSGDKRPFVQRALSPKDFLLGRLNEDNLVRCFKPYYSYPDYLDTCRNCS